MRKRDHRKYYAEHKKERRKASRKWKKHNPDKERRAANKRTESLHDCYIKIALRTQLKISYNEMTPQMIQLKRQQLIFHRLLKQLEEKINGIN